MRRAELSDVAGIADILGPASNVFNFNCEPNILDTIEKAIFSITCTNEHGAIVGHASFYDAPHPACAPPDIWETVVFSQFHVPQDLMPGNTIFIQLFATASNDGNHITRDLLRTLVDADPGLRYICMMIPAVSRSAWEQLELAPLFRELAVHSLADALMYVCDVVTLTPPVCTRVAKQSDYDDLFPILNLQSETAKQRCASLGDYYLADLIANQDSRHHVIVAEVNGKPVGFMNVDSIIDYSTLDLHYNMAVFDNLQDKGTQSAFAIRIFTMAPRFDNHALVMVEKAFMLFPELHYCIITIPTTSQEMQILQHFTLCPAKSHSVVPQQLYVCHRYGLRDVTVCKTLPANIEDIRQLLTSVSDRDSILAAVEEGILTGKNADGHARGVYQMVALGAVVGVAVCSDAASHAMTLRAHFNVEDYILFPSHPPAAHMFVDYLILNPIFQRRAKFFLREVLRMLKKTCLYHRVYPASLSTVGTLTEEEPCNVSSMDIFIPSRRRRQIQYPPGNLGGNVPSAKIRDLSHPYSLVFLTRKLMMEHKLTVNIRLVIVGASETSLSFIETLLYKAHLRFNNIIIISPEGITPEEKPGDTFASSYGYTLLDHRQIAWRTWVNVVSGTVDEIHRDRKNLVLAGGFVVPYDFLVLAPGLQYHRKPHGVVAVPASVTSINSKADLLAKVACIGSVSSAAEDTLDVPPAPVVDPATRRVVIYGRTIDAHTVLQTLLTIPSLCSAGQLVYVVPGTAAAGGLSPEVEKYLLDQLRQRGVQVHVDTNLDAMESRGAELKVSYFSGQGRLKSSTPELTIVHRLFINLERKSVSEHNFKMCNSASLAVDGRLVVDHNHRTTDPAIFAGGSFTKFSRRYYADDYLPELYSGVDVGMHLANAMTPFLDPLTPPSDMPGYSGVESITDKLLPRYTAPKVTFGIVAGGLQLVHIASIRGGFLPTSYDSVTGCTVLRTGTLPIGGALDDRTVHYCALVLDPFSVVQSITCLSKDDVDIRNLVCLVGLHEKFLNNLLARYNEGLIPDLLSFFRGAWAMALYHDRFPSTLASYVKNASSAAYSEEKRNNDATNPEYTALPDLAQGLHNAREQLMAYLSQNSYHLPMYVRSQFLDAGPSSV